MVYLLEQGSREKNKGKNQQARKQGGPLWGVVEGGYWGMQFKWEQIGNKEE